MLALGQQWAKQSHPWAHLHILEAKSVDLVREKLAQKVSILEMGWQFSPNSDPILLLTAADTIEAFSSELAIAAVSQRKGVKESPVKAIAPAVDEQVTPSVEQKETSPGIQQETSPVVQEDPSEQISRDPEQQIAEYVDDDVVSSGAESGKAAGEKEMERIMIKLPIKDVTLTLEALDREAWEIVGQKKVAIDHGTPLLTLASSLTAEERHGTCIYSYVVMKNINKGTSIPPGQTPRKNWPFNFDDQDLLLLDTS